MSLYGKKVKSIMDSGDVFDDDVNGPTEYDIDNVVELYP